MPLPININDLLHGKSVEWERLEFKEGWNPQAVLHTLCAFANDFHNFGGGYVIIGVGEKEGHAVLPPAGLAPVQLDAIQKEVLNLGHSAMQPTYHPVMVPEVVDGKQVLVLWAPGGQTRPYKAKLALGKESKELGYFIRKGSSTVRAKGADEQELMSLAATVPFDDRINLQATLADLDLGLIRTFLRAIRSDLYRTSARMDFEALCRQMQIVDGPAEAVFPRNIGLLFFNEEPHRFFPQTQIDLVILSYPGPDRSVRLDQLRIGRALPRRYRNRRIGDFLKELEITEGRSTGIPKIFRAMDRNGSPRPEFEFDDDHSFFLVRLPRHTDFSKEDAIPQTESGSITAPVTGQVEDQSQLESKLESQLESQLKARVVLALREAPIGKKGLSLNLGQKSISGQLHQVVRELVESGWIEPTIVHQPHSRLQKYRLTRKGAEWLATNKSTHRT